ncbi:MAG: MBL fold metallo-hydrolase [Defluviitaleaceae bacterium]|nr:MBL fold metallo-hydrolase [Defluviitaleaceae bacterium]
MKIKKILAVLLGCALLFLPVAFVLFPQIFGMENAAPCEYCASVDVRVFGIGRADAILITTDHHAMLIDTGENQHGDYLLAHLRALDITFLDYVIITHFDSDHVGGAHTIIDAISIGEVIVPNYNRETRHAERFETALERAGLVPYVLTQPRYISLDCVNFVLDASALPYMHFARVADDDYYYDELHGDEINDIDFAFTGNDFSIVVSMTHGHNHFLFTGDATHHRLADVLQNNALMNANNTWLKIPRHGRHTRNAVELIHQLQPRYAVITGFHPNDFPTYSPERPTDWRIVQALEYVGAQVFYTMSTGVHFRSDGLELTVAYIE